MPFSSAQSWSSITLCMLSAMAGHSRAGPLLPHRNWGPGEIVGGGKGQGTVDSAANWCLLWACEMLFWEVGREDGGNTSPSRGDQPSSLREMPLLGRFPSLVPGIYWHVLGRSGFEAFLFYCQSSSVSQCVSPTVQSQVEKWWICTLKLQWKGRNVAQTLPEPSPSISKGFQQPKPLVWCHSPEFCKMMLCSTHCRSKRWKSGDVGTVLKGAGKGQVCCYIREVL